MEFRFVVSFGFVIVLFGHVGKSFNLIFFFLISKKEIEIKKKEKKKKLLVKVLLRKILYTKN